MSDLNPQAVLLVAFTTVVGFLSGSWAWGCAVGLGLVLGETLKARWDAYDPVAELLRRRRRR